MPVPETYLPDTYTGNGVVTVFAYSFRVIAASHILATVDGVQRNDITVSNVGNPSGGTVTFGTAPANGLAVVISRNVPYSRSFDYQENGDLLAATLDDDIDTVTMQVQQLLERLKRTASLALGSPLTGTLTLPAPSSLKYLRWNSGATNLENADAVLDSGNFTASGVGAVTRPVVSKLADLVAPTDYAISATPDMSPDWQAGLNAAAGGLLFVPARNWRLDLPITVPANTWILAFGSTLDFSNAGNIACITFAGGGGILGAKIIGAGNAAYNAAGMAIKCVGTNNSPAAPTYIDGPTVMHCDIREFSSYGVHLQYVNGGHVDKNKFRGIGYAAVGGLSCNDLTADHNDIEEVSPGTGGGDCYGIFIDRLETGNETVEPRSYRCSMSNNTIRNVIAASGNNGQGIDTHAGVDFRIVGNTVDGCEVGIFVTSSAIAGVQTLAPKRVTVTGNTINGALAGYGIQVSGALDSGTVVEYAPGIVVESNTINGHGIAGDSTSGAIRLQATKGLVVSDNTLRAPACNGIVFNLENKGFNCTGNNVTNPHDGTMASPACLSVQGNNNEGQIGGNVLRYDAADVAGLGTNRAVHSIRVGNHTGLNIEIGPATLIGIDATHLTYSEATTTGVNPSGLCVQRGTATLAAGTVNVVFPKRMPTAAINLKLSTSANETMRWSSKAATGFTITSSNGASTADVDWEACT